MQIKAMMDMEEAANAEYLRRKERKDMLFQETVKAVRAAPISSTVQDCTELKSIYCAVQYCTPASKRSPPVHVQMIQPPSFLSQCSVCLSNS